VWVLNQIIHRVILQGIDVLGFDSLCKIFFLFLILGKEVGNSHYSNGLKGVKSRRSALSHYSWRPLYPHSGPSHGEVWWSLIVINLPFE